METLPPPIVTFMTSLKMWWVSPNVMLIKEYLIWPSNLLMEAKWEDGAVFTWRSQNLLSLMTTMFAVSAIYIYIKQYIYIYLNQ